MLQGCSIATFKGGEYSIRISHTTEADDAKRQQMGRGALWQRRAPERYLFLNPSMNLAILCQLSPRDEKLTILHLRRGEAEIRGAFIHRNDQPRDTGRDVQRSRLTVDGFKRNPASSSSSRTCAAILSLPFSNDVSGTSLPSLEFRRSHGRVAVCYRLSYRGIDAPLPPDPIPAMPSHNDHQHRDGPGPSSYYPSLRP